MERFDTFPFSSACMQCSHAGSSFCKPSCVLIPYKKIITHAGQAHTDDFLATAVLAHLFGIAIYRVNEVATDDLEDEYIIVVDIGGEFNPQRNNFDHHHDKNLPCSLIMVLQKFFPEIPTDSIEELDFIDTWDRFGPVATQKKFGLKLPSFRDTIAEVVLRIFSNAEVIEPHTWLYEMLRAIGKEFLNYLKEQKELLEKAKNAKVFEIRGLKVVQLGENVPIRFIKAVHSDVAIVIQPNQRLQGALSLTRVDDHPQVDFNRIKDKVPAHFIHVNGFMAVVDPEHVSEALELAIQ